MKRVKSWIGSKKILLAVKLATLPSDYYPNPLYKSSKCKAFVTTHFAEIRRRQHDLGATIGKYLETPFILVYC